MQVFPSNEKIENINDQYWTLRAEEVGISSYKWGLKPLEYDVFLLLFALIVTLSDYSLDI